MTGKKTESKKKEEERTQYKRDEDIVDTHELAREEEEKEGE